MSSSCDLPRRNFIKKSSLAVSSFLFLPAAVLGRQGYAAPNDKLNLAFIGAGGRGGHNLRQLEDENVIALADVDSKEAEHSYQRYENVPKYYDFRKMLDQHENEIDAVVVSTPDHTHTVAALDAIRRYKHVYVEKPLAHSIKEVRTLMHEANKHHVQTQLGNQGHSFNDIRKVYEWIDQGAIGDVTEVQIWYLEQYGDGTPAPRNSETIPSTLEWNLWLGPASYRQYHPCYLPGIWRSWHDFGTGIMGDWVCHVLDPAYWALDLNAPTTVTAVNSGKDWSKDRYPLESVITYEFPARGEKPPVKVVWTYGKQPDLPQLEGIDLSDRPDQIGGLIIGDKGCIMHRSHGAGGAHILPEERAKEVGEPEQTIPRIQGGHHRDWVRACKEGKPASSNFSYGGPLTEVALLGAIASHHPEQKLEWDYSSMSFKNSGFHSDLVEPVYHGGWSL